MAEFYISLLDQLDNEVPLPFGAQVVPKWYSETAIGGSERAQIEIYATPSALRGLLRCLGYRLIIYNRNMTPVWNGILDEISLALGGFTIGLSIREMYNRISVLYSTTEDNATISGETAWAQDNESVTRYGYKELRYSAADTTADQAVNLRDTLLGQ